MEDDEKSKKIKNSICCTCNRYRYKKYIYKDDNKKNTNKYICTIPNCINEIFISFYKFIDSLNTKNIFNYNKSYNNRQHYTKNTYNIIENNNISKMPSIKNKNKDIDEKKLEFELPKDSKKIRTLQINTISDSDSEINSDSNSDSNSESNSDSNSDSNLDTNSYLNSNIIKDKVTNKNNKLIKNLNLISRIKKGDKLIIDDKGDLHIDSSKIQFVTRYYYKQDKLNTINKIDHYIRVALTIPDKDIKLQIKNTLAGINNLILTYKGTIIEERLINIKNLIL